MKKTSGASLTALSLLAALAVSVPSGAEAGEAARVEQKPGVVAVQLPASLATQVPTDRPVRLTLSHGGLGQTSVVGRARFAHKNVVEIVTSERLSFLPTDGTEIAFSEGTSSAESCGNAEHGIGCFLKGCIGTAYCLPGGNPDTGFTCSCQ